jgi:hypothetical protein
LSIPRTWQQRQLEKVGVPGSQEGTA